MGEREIIAATFDGRLKVVRQEIFGGERVDRVVYEQVPCALSRAAHTAAPAPAALHGHIGESEYRMTLFTRPEVCIKAGDRVRIRQGGRIFSGISSDGFCYPSHCVAVITLLEQEEE